MVGGHGLGYLVPRMKTLFGTDNYLVGTVDGGKVKVSMGDAYWITPLLRRGGYEPEVASVLHRSLRSDSAFIDCGANIGYWSVLAAGLIGTRDRVVAIEASPHAAGWLRENAALNSGSFRAVEAAVWSESGESVEVAVDVTRHSWASSDPHIASALINMGFASRQAETITIDDTVRHFVTGEPRLFVLKVDVEGSEERGLQGAVETLKRDVLVIYEEHGRSSHSRATRVLLNEFDMEIFYISSHTGPILIESVEQLAEKLTDVSRGYNLCAARAGTEAHRRLTLPIA